MNQGNSAVQRLGIVKSHLDGIKKNPTNAISTTKHDDDVVIVSARRTAICKARKGGFKVNIELLI